jgi:hypothetical protein
LPNCIGYSIELTINYLIINVHHLLQKINIFALILFLPQCTQSYRESPFTPKQAYQCANIHLNAFVAMLKLVHAMIVIHGLLEATRHLPIYTFSGIESWAKDVLVGLGGSPLQGRIQFCGGCSWPKDPAKGWLGAMMGQFSRASMNLDG